MDHANNKKSFYITTTIPYVNADPHIGFALELVQSDAIARYKRLMGFDVFFSTGTDEFGQKIWEASQKQGITAQEYVDHYAGKFLDLKGTLNLSIDNFIRTTTKDHVEAVQEFWRLCDKKGDIYKATYTGIYCVGCETFYTEKDLVDGKCPIHLTVPENVEEENYFFKLKNYKKQLLEYVNHEGAIIPEWRRKEASNFIENAMEDFSISRSKKRLSWGVPIPGDDTQVMYVWFGAFVNYISTLGWPQKKEQFEKFWQDGETVQTAGKDMVKFQSVMWQGMLMSADLATTNKILYHGFITGEGGIKMSKSLGNVINPNDIVKEYGTDALRYFLLAEISSFEDSPFTMERFKDAYNAKLANGLGNLTSRIMKMAETNLENFPDLKKMELSDSWKPALQAMENFNSQEAMNIVFKHATELDELIQNKQPFKLIKTDKDEAVKIIEDLVIKLQGIGQMLAPLLPETSQKIMDIVVSKKMPEVPLFLRKD